MAFYGVYLTKILSPPKLKGRKKSLAGRMWPAGRTLAISDIEDSICVEHLSHLLMYFYENLKIIYNKTLCFTVANC